MNPITVEWVQKAEGDLATAGREIRARKFPNFDASCFHSQQTAEKYLKAFLHEHGSPIPYTHSLIELLALCLNFDPSFNLLRPDLVRLDGYAVRYRYPGHLADRLEAKTAYRAAQFARQFIRDRLGLA